MFFLYAPCVTIALHGYALCVKLIRIDIVSLCESHTHTKNYKDSKNE